MASCYLSEENGSKMIRLFKFILFLIIVLAILSLLPTPLNWADTFIQKNFDKPWAATAYYQLGNHCYRVLKFQKALEIYERALRKFPKHRMAPLARFRRAVCLEKLKRYRQAIRAYEDFVDRYPDHYLKPQAENSLKKLKEIYK